MNLVSIKSLSGFPSGSDPRLKVLALLATYLAGYTTGLLDPRDGFTDPNLPAQVLPSLQALTPTRRR